MAFKGGTRTPCLRQQGLTAGFAFANFHSSREAQTAETEHRGVNAIAALAAESIRRSRIPLGGAPHHNPSLFAMGRPLLTLSSVLSSA